LHISLELATDWRATQFRHGRRSVRSLAFPEEWMFKRTMVCVLIAACFATTAAFAQGADSSKAAAPAAAAAKSPAEGMTYSKATIALKGEATAHGAIAFTFIAVGGAEKHVTVTVIEKTKDKNVAKDLAKEFKSEVGDGFKVSQSGDKVEIQVAKKGGPMFHVSLHSNTATGVAVTIK
jgi:hypothetical protein